MIYRIRIFLRLIIVVSPTLGSNPYNHITQFCISLDVLTFDVPCLFTNFHFHSHLYCISFGLTVNIDFHVLCIQPMLLFIKSRCKQTKKRPMTRISAAFTQFSMYKVIFLLFVNPFYYQLDHTQLNINC